MSPERKEIRLTTTNSADEETRSVTAPEPKTIQADLSAQWNYLSTTNNLFEKGSQSLIVESGVTHQGLFSTGDRFIPYRAADETWNSGQVRFYHEESLLLSR